MTSFSSLLVNNPYEIQPKLDVGRHLYISRFGAIVIEEARRRGREDILDPCTE